MNTIQVTPDLQLDKATEKLFELKSDEESYKIIPNEFKVDNNEQNSSLFKSENSSWFIFKSTKTIEKPKNYKINEGDILKLGRITAIVREIKLNSENDNYNIKTNEKFQVIKKDLSYNTNLNYKETNIVSNGIEINANEIENKEKRKKKKICRICYIEDDTDENPLIQPCICSGTMRYIHLDCLKQWIGTKSLIKLESNDKCTIYKIKPVECELCKSKLPDYVKHNNILYCVLDHHSDYKSYICIESLSVDKRKNRFLYIGNLENKKEIKIGRGHDCDLLLSDVSISRLRCKLINSFNGLYIEDNNSKFGTLILIQTPILKLSESLPLYMQVGRTFMQIKIKRPFSLFGCCDISEKKDEYYYHKQNEKEIDYHKNIIIKEENENDDDSESEISNNDKSNNHGLKVIEYENTDKNNDVDIHINRVTTIDDIIENEETRRNKITNIPIKTIGTIINEEEKEN